MGFVRFETRFKQETLKKLERISELDGISIAESIREAVHEYIMKKGN